jgi:hypothetical protein
MKLIVATMQHPPVKAIRLAISRLGIVTNPPEESTILTERRLSTQEAIISKVMIPMFLAQECALWNYSYCIYSCSIEMRRRTYPKARS